MDRPTPLTGEHLALDLLNTRPGGFDVFDSPESAADWLAVEADRLPQPTGPLSDADLGALRAVREIVLAVLVPAARGDRPARQHLASLTRAQRDAPAYGRLDWDGARVTVTTDRDGPYVTRLLATLAAAAGELLSSDALGKVRMCEGPDCTTMFIPANPRRQWCSPAVCGNRVRVARYYNRHKLPS
ncbi:ABATE domain-containing protein [Longispora sp. K20-0274]|uniref:CGNR zinc finger domain-containing protein n=1 Tax=Longispora sp. K20-0274 TaxID=3088255 RepID=UPI00399A4409